jgi:NAD(P) transhydrogenase subunit alpha
MATTLFVPKERNRGERRVALAPALVSHYLERGLRVLIEKNVGKAAGFPDASYEGVEVVAEPAFAEANVALTVRGLATDQIAQLKPGAAVVGLLAAHEQDFPAEAYRKAGARAFALEKLPRISRAQSMDALSSQAAAAGYRAVLLAALELPRFFPMLTTAAGTVRPARVLVIGAGVAGLQAIATAHRLGAIVEGYDVRAAAREQVESLGARFVDTGVGAEGGGGYARELTDEERAQQAATLAEHVTRANVVITTAAVPGKAAPKILDKKMIEGMEAGSAIVDLAAASGGNCELTKPDKTVHHRGVAILGPTNAASGLAAHASEMYARNCYNFVAPWFDKDGALAIPTDDEIYTATLVAGELAAVKSEEG